MVGFSLGPIPLVTMETVLVSKSQNAIILQRNPALHPKKKHIILFGTFIATSNHITTRNNKNLKHYWFTVRWSQGSLCLVYCSHYPLSRDRFYRTWLAPIMAKPNGHCPRSSVLNLICKPKSLKYEVAPLGSRITHLSTPWTAKDASN